MTAERWAQIKTILNSALERPKGKRREFLEAACGHDPELREEVERLLAGEEEASLESAAAGLRNRTAPELSPGEMLAHYRIKAKVGQGGMGAVYRARDCKLGREVALKVLPEDLSGNADYMARFQREAQILASLNHPHIATIYGIERDAIVMELVEGATLAGRIAKGAVPVPEALDIARQIADALEYAHERGVIHRDLKPANVMITPECVVKVLDFGLAKMMRFEERGAEVDTLTPPAGGRIMGTPAYMAPEQASGEAVDSRADVWAFGVVLFEMLTGRRLFEAGSAGDTLTAVLARDPDWSLLPKDTPRWVEHLLRRCLERDRRKRLHGLGDAFTDAGAVLEEPAAGTARRRLPWIAAAASAFAAALALWAPWRAAPPAASSPVFFDIEAGAPPSSIAVSPDGMRVVFRAGSGPLLTRRLDQDGILPLAGTEGGRDPFFSPDGRWLGFFSGGKLRKLRVGQGVPVTVCDAVDARGGTWGEDGHIVAALNVTGGLSSVNADGGKPEWITGLHGETDDGTTHRFPRALPHGKGILFTAFSAQQGSVWVLKPGSRQPKLLLKNARDGRYLASGYLVYYSGGSLLAAPMDLDRLEVTGPGVPFVSGAISRFTLWGNVGYDLSPGGTLVYVRGSAETTFVLSWLDPSGRIEPLLSNPERYLNPRLSPDGKRLAITIQRSDYLANVWVYDRGRETMTPMPAGGEYQWGAVWTPDGEYLVFQSDGKLAWTRADGGSRVEHLPGTRNAFPYSFSPDGGRLFFHQSTAGNYDLWDVAVRDGGLRFGQPRPLTGDPAAEQFPAISPDGKWLAYVTLIDSVRPEVFVAALSPDGRLSGRKWQVSNRSGSEPIWAAKGRYLFYVGAGGVIMVVTYTADGGVFVPSKPRMWSSERISGRQFAYDVAPDGRRVLALRDAGNNPATPDTRLHVLINAGAEVGRRAAAGN